MRGILVFGIAFLASSWAASIPENPEALRTVTKGMNQFAKEFYMKIVKDVNDNLIMSPVGVSMVTAMASFGAGGNTKTQIQSALNMPTDDATAKSGLRMMMDQPKGMEGVELKMANRIFTNKGVEMKPAFKEVTEKTFDSMAETLDFSKPEATQTINAWAAEQTNNKIQNLMQPDDIKDASMVLANAVYFKGKWKTPFEAKNTMPKTFHPCDKTTKEVPMMHKMEKMFYAELPDVNAKVVELPYQREKDNPGKYVSMFVFVPNEINGLKDLEKNLNTLGLEKIRERGSMREVILDMPKFKIESTIDLKSAMQEMGMTDMFTDNADFTGITDSPPLKVGKATQKAMIEVNEEGSEAAAVTTIVMVPMSLPMPFEPPVTLTVDRPFYFSIVMHDNDPERGASRVMLFSGRVHDPTM